MSAGSGRVDADSFLSDVSSGQGLLVEEKATEVVAVGFVFNLRVYLHTPGCPCCINSSAGILGSPSRCTA